MNMMRRIDRPLEIKSIEATGEFSGYGSVFGNEDSYGDIVVKGAFEKTLSEYDKRKSLPSLLWQHRQDQPIGVYTDMKEDDNGLYVEGQLLVDSVSQAKEAHALMSAGAVRGLSIGYALRSAEAYDYDPEKDVFLLKEIDLYEVSVVTIPANDEARVDTVKSMFMKGQKPYRKDVERAIRDMFGCSVSQAKRFMAEGMSAFVQDDEQAEALEALQYILKSRKSA